MIADPRLTADELLGLGLSPKTAYVYCRIWLRLDQAGLDLETCTGPDIAKVALGWTQSHSARSQLRAAINAAWELIGRTDRPSLRAVRIPPRPRMRCLAVEADEAARLEATAWARQDLAGLAVIIGMYTALRRAEIAKVRWDDFTWGPDGVPTWLRVWGKGDVVAELPVHPVLAGLLAEIGGRRGWLFPGRSGGPVVPATIWNWVRSVGAEAGVPIRTHMLRHTALAEANDRSGDLRAVQVFARHSRPETTTGYTRTTNERLRQVVGLIDYGRSA